MIGTRDTVKSDVYHSSWPEHSLNLGFALANLRYKLLSPGGFLADGFLLRDSARDPIAEQSSRAYKIGMSQ
jgi:hypothetical protein